jgi:hypothetical protein
MPWLNFLQLKFMHGVEIKLQGVQFTCNHRVFVAIGREAENHKNDHQDRQACVLYFFVVGLSKQVGVL